MNLSLPTPRLMPFTIAALAAVLMMRVTGLAQRTAGVMWSAPASVVTPAAAAVPAKPTPTQAPVALPSTPSPDEPAISDAERKLLLDLRRRREELDARDAALTARESLLAAAEQKLAARVEELSALQKNLEALEAARNQRQEAGWLGLVKLYEDMKPRDAAAIFNDLQMPVLLALVDRMNERKAASVLAAMNPDKARELTAQLAQLRTRREIPGATPRNGG